MTGDHKEWQRQHKEVTKSIGNNQTAFIERKCDEMEKSGNDSKKVFGVVKELIQGSSTRSNIINSKEGETLTE